MASLNNRFAVVLVGLSLASLASAYTHRIIPHFEITNPLVLQACNSTQHMDLCLETFRISSMANKADLAGVAEIAVEGAMRKMRTTSVHIKNLLNRNHAPTTQQCIRDCSENYDEVAENLGKAKEELAKVSCNYNDVITWVSAALTDGSTCEQGCQSQPIEKGVLSKWNSEFNQLCSNALAVVKFSAAGK